VRDVTLFDPMFCPHIIAPALGIPGPPTCEDTVYFMFGQNLQHDPGTKVAYSNLGYCILGLVIEKVTGKSYEAVLRELVLDESGVSRKGMYLGSTLLDDIPEYETEYYCHPFCTPGPSIYPEESGPLPIPYGGGHSIDTLTGGGGFSVETIKAEGGWVASASEYLLAVADYPEEITQTGGLPGTATMLQINMTNGYTWAFLTNRQGTGLGVLSDVTEYVEEMMWDAIDCVDAGGSWPPGFVVKTLEEEEPAHNTPLSKCFVRVKPKCRSTCHQSVKFQIECTLSKASQLCYPPEDLPSKQEYHSKIVKKFKEYCKLLVSGCLRKVKRKCRLTCRRSGKIQKKCSLSNAAQFCYLPKGKVDKQKYLSMVVRKLKEYCKTTNN